MSEAKVGIGDVAITLGGHEYVLVPTVAAIKGISRSSGGIRGATEAVMRMDLDRIVSVIEFGLGPRQTKELGGTDKLLAMVFASGLTDSSGGVVMKCITYLTNLANGGRPIDDTTEGGDTEGKPPSV